MKFKKFEIKTSDYKNYSFENGDELLLIHSEPS